MRPALLALLLTACTAEQDKSTPAADDTGPATTDDSAASDLTRDTISGTITWNADFDSDAEAAGAVDCSYTRSYTGVEDRSAPWLCPSCELLFHADVAIIDGQDCYDQITTSTPSASEWLGYAGGLWYRASSSALSERGPAEVSGDTLTVSQEAEDAGAVSGGNYSFLIEGSLILGEEDGDPMHGLAAPDSYTCGWPKADPPAYTGDYVATVGGELPDGLFPDACNESVRLHDFAGRYLLVDISAMDCGPCQSAAKAEDAFVEELAAEGIDVSVITLLAPSLSNTAATASTDEIESWMDRFDVSSPVLGDRVWGLSVLAPAVGDDFGYPTFALVDPDLKIMELHVGFGSFDDIADAIRADAATR